MASATTTDAIEPLELAGIRDQVREPHRLRGRAWVVVAVALVAAVVAVVSAALRSSAAIGPGRVLTASLVVLGCLCAVFAASRRPDESLPLLMAGAALAAATAMLGAAMLGRDLGDAEADTAAALRALGAVAIPVIGLALALGLPDGRLGSRARRVTVGFGVVVAVGLGAWLFTERPELPTGALLAFGAACAVVGVGGAAIAARRAPLVDLPRFQWPAWAVGVALAIGVGAAILNALVDWPEPILAIAVGGTALLPVSLAIAATDELAVRIDRLLVHTITLAGLAGLVGAAYLLIVLGLGRTPDGDERALLGLSMLAAAVAALLWVPTRTRLAEFASQRVYGERHAPEEVLRTFGSRLTRAVPLDELLLQLAESLKTTMALEVAEVWTRSPSGRLERTVSVPDRGPADLVLGPQEETVVARAGVSGPAWARVWVPSLVPTDGDDPILRVVPVTNSGQLHGLLVVRRPAGAAPFDEPDDQALTELARQVGLALHNVKLDSALQESLDEVRRGADELRASRARIVQAGDEQRRTIERNLHDGAQQHLVALAVSVRLARQLAEKAPDQALPMLDQIGADLQDAVQELRNLAHGIYPPLLAERGLGEALSAAAGRAALPTSVEAEGIGRYAEGTEAAVYFCVLEALQNAGKHAGEGAEIVVSLREQEGALLFEVADSGAGFDMATGAHKGQGFVNMADRVGAIGGSLSVDSAPGRGTTIAGRVPVAA